MAQRVRQADCKQCHEQPLGGPRLPVQPPFCRPGSRSSGWCPLVGTCLCRGAVIFHPLPLLCGFAAWNALPPTFQVSPPSQPSTPPPPLGCLPRPSRADTPKTLLALSTPSTQNLSSGSSRRVTFCLYRDTSGAYLLSPNRCTLLGLGEPPIDMESTLVSVGNSQVRRGIIIRYGLNLEVTLYSAVGDLTCPRLFIWCYLLREWFRSTFWLPQCLQWTKVHGWHIRSPLSPESGNKMHLF